MLRFTLSIGLLLIAACLSAAGQSPQKDSGEDSSNIYVVGGDVKPPTLIHYVEPASSQAAYVEGVVRISTVVELNGAPSDMHVTKGLNAEEDRLALEALSQWRFKPGTKNSQPVRVRINVEITFHLL